MRDTRDRDIQLPIARHRMMRMRDSIVRLRRRCRRSYRTHLLVHRRERTIILTYLRLRLLTVTPMPIRDPTDIKSLGNTPGVCHSLNLRLVPSLELGSDPRHSWMIAPNPQSWLLSLLLHLLRCARLHIQPRVIRNAQERRNSAARRKRHIDCGPRGMNCRVQRTPNWDQMACRRRRTRRTR